MFPEGLLIRESSASSGFPPAERVSSPGDISIYSYTREPGEGAVRKKASEGRAAAPGSPTAPRSSQRLLFLKHWPNSRYAELHRLPDEMDVPGFCWVVPRPAIFA